MRYLASLLLLVFSFSAQAFFSNQQDFLPVEEAFQLELLETPDNNSVLYWTITPGHYLYRHSISAVDADGNAVELSLPDGLENEDEFFGLTYIYRTDLQVPLAPDQPRPHAVTWQGCADAGLCYPPQTTEVGLTAASHQPQDTSAALAGDLGIAQQLASAGLLVNLAAFFAMGLLLAFTPCMLPMLPILSSVIAGSKPGGWQGAKLGAAFVVAMSLVYAALGVIAAQLGSNLAAALQNPWLLLPFAGLFILLAMAQFGLYSLQLPAFIRERLQKTDRNIKGGNLLGATALGVLSALLVGPCMTAPLAGALLYIGQSGDSLKGGLVLFSLGLGSGLPLLLAMSFGMRWLPKPGQWMEHINRIFGYALLAAAIFIVRGLLPDSLVLALWAALLLAVAVHLASLQPRGWTLFTRFTGILLGVWASIMLMGAASGGSDPWQPLRHLQGGTTATVTQQPVRIADPAQLKEQLRQAQEQNQWVIMDFYADWCISCKVMERTVFGQPDVQAAISGMRFLQPDVTDNTAAQQALLKEYGIIGPPTIIFVNPQGREVRSARITGEVNAAEFLAYLQQARSE
ncbi:protein-disulfide reductase DsbD [Thiopseudomonas denitrificans]|uniref:Thiol:disulfide interchange protein DsbD n=1 Tax=Thiopseudomonas denitrificans TaxID=1501432 RepID=A0A4R6TZ00_9GAMM|nr:protein-disulfide reductase DsbD [Thiopseudomonas denitrificans]TDQ37279.1 thiol:disulfide interchange protein DsbD [Thiopseudomonas denitrificans]